MPILERATRAYVAGDEFDDAIRVTSSAVERGCGVTICYWQPPDEAPDSVAENYLKALKRLRSRQGVVQVRC